MVMNEFETFCKLVADYWPRCRTTEAQLRIHWENVVCNHKPGVVSAALSKCVSEYPDDTAPKWKAIFAYLYGKSERRAGGKSEFELLLNQSRAACKGDAVPTSGNLSDEDAWLRWLRVLTQSTRSSMSPNHDGKCERLRKLASSRAEVHKCGLSPAECRARAEEERTTNRWRWYLDVRGDPIPVFLQDDYAKPEVVARQPGGTLF